MTDGDGPTVAALARFGHWRLDRPSGRVAWSDEALRLFGYRHDHEGPSFAMLLAAFPAPAQIELRRGVARTCETGEEVTVVSAIRRRDGSRGDVLIRFRAEPGEGGAGREVVAGITLDVTEARAFDERLQREKDLLQTTLDHMDQGLIVVEPDMSVPVLGKRTIELLNLPEAFAETRPSFREILDYQRDSGAITAEMLNSSINSFILEGEDLPQTHVYERETVDGRVLEVRTTRLPEGGFVRTFTDQTARRRREEAFAEAQAEYRNLFENSITGIYRSTADGRLLRANPAMVRMNGYASEAEMLAAVGDIARECYVDPARRETLKRLLRDEGRVTDFVTEIHRHRTRERIWISETAWAIRDGSGAMVAYEGTVIEVTERKRAEDRIAHMARHDGLTGLANRLAFNEGLEAALGAGDRQLALICLDLDRFKIVNDTMGHPTGDALLQALARRFERVVGADGTMARLGGDEFAVLMPGAGHGEAAAMAGRLIAAGRAPVEIGARPVSVGISLGCAVAPRDGADTTQLLKCADLALYRAKAEGDTHRFYAPEMDAAVQERQRLELDLRRALEGAEFRLLYQPIVRLADRAIIGFEALLRWSHPAHGAIPPETFIAIAEETRMIVPIGEWVLARACAEAVHLPAESTVAVNVSTVQLAQPRFEAMLTQVLAASGLAPERLVIEVTETALMDSRVDVAPMLARLRARGIVAALDDFGTGYSSLGYLQRFKFDILKIDRAFARGMAGPETTAIVETVLDLGRRLGIRTIAEGVETEAQADALLRAGCDCAQGHLFGEARPVSDIARPPGA